MRSFIAPLVAFALTASVGCNNGGGFAGGGGNEQAPGAAKEEGDENQDPKPKNKSTTQTAAAAGTATDVETDDPKAGAGAPSYAVADGRFKAWTVPQIPSEKEDYQVFIQVTLPSGGGAQSVAKTDLSGLIKGSDGFEQKIEQAFDKIPGPIPIAVPFDPRGKFEVKGGVATLSFFVPYAPRHESDTITVRSKVLNEDATLTINY